MNSKILGKKKRDQSAKVAVSKKATTPVTEENIKEQYQIIRNDILKLREDLSRGYDMARGIVEKKGLISQLLKAK